jgi:SAM-dependent methyltransferase
VSFPEGKDQNRAVRRAFDLLADRHQEFLARAGSDDYSREIEAALAPVFARLKTGCRVLDMGCGNGQWGSRFVNAGYLVHGFDLSGRMIAIAHQLQPDMPICQMDAQTLGLAGAQYSLLLAIGDLISYSGCPRELLREARRVAQPGAVLVGTVISTGGLLAQEAHAGRTQALARLVEDGFWIERSEQEMTHLSAKPSSDAHAGEGGVERPLTLTSYTRDRLTGLLQANQWDPVEIRGIGVLRRISAGTLIGLHDTDLFRLEQEFSRTSPWLEISTNLYFIAQARAIESHTTLSSRSHEKC